MRKKEYEKDNSVEKILKSMNEILTPVEDSLIQNYSKPQHPTVFIVGTQRSGTTLLMQLLIKNFRFFYINNFIARFWATPYIGSILLKSLQLPGQNSSDWFDSDLGYTKGIFGAHEFSYFWKNFFPEIIDEANLEGQCCIDAFKLKKTIAALQSIEESALLVKNLTIAAFHIKELKKILSNVYFIYIERDPKVVIQSTYQSRLKLYGNEQEWFGLKPPQYHEIKDLPVFEQIAAQVKYTIDYLNGQLESISEDYYCKIRYEDLVDNTKTILTYIENQLGQIGIPKKGDNISFPKFENRNKLNLDTEKTHLLQNAYQKYF